MTTDEMTQPMQAITYRLPPVVIDKLDEIAELAAQQSEQPVVVADVYRWAFGCYLDPNFDEPDWAAAVRGGLLVRTELKLHGEPTRTVCVHISVEMRQGFDTLLDAQRQATKIPALARSLTVSQLFSAAVGALLLSLGVRVNGWNC